MSEKPKFEYVVRWTSLLTNEISYTGTREDDHWSEKFAWEIALWGTIHSEGYCFGVPEMKAALGLKQKLNHYLRATGRCEKYDTGDGAFSGEYIDAE